MGTWETNRTGHVKIFRRDLDSGWNLVESIEGTDNLDHFGTSVAVSEFGNIIAIGADPSSPNSTSASGFVEVYETYNDENKSQSFSHGISDIIFVFVAGLILADLEAEFKGAHFICV